MKALLIYNKEDSREIELMNRAKQEISNLITEVDLVDFNLVRDKFSIRTTPTLIIVRDDLQGMHLLEEDMENNQLRITGELVKALDEEDKNIHNAEANRIDKLINSEVQIKMGENYQVMQDMASLLEEAEVL